MNDPDQTIRDAIRELNDQRPFDPALDPDFEAQTYPPPPTRFADWTSQLESADFATLRLLANGGTGDVTPS